MDFETQIEGEKVFRAPFDYLGDPDEAVVIFESATPEKISEFAAMQTRAQGMSLALVWLEDKDFSFSALEALVVGMADIDGDAEISEDEQEIYNEVLSAAGEALVKLGGKKENVQDFIDDESDDAGKKLGVYLARKMDGIESDDDELVSNFAVSGGAILEAAYRRVKTIKDGRVVFKKKRLTPKRLSAKQRAGLRKARRKANTGAARKAREKSMRQRKARGL